MFLTGKLTNKMTRSTQETHKEAVCQRSEMARKIINCTKKRMTFLYR
jgi:hypothetical protein